MLFGLPGVPCIYYGDEIGMQGYRDPFNRGYFTWWAMDKYILNNIKSISKFRNSHKVFEEGGIHFVYSSDECVAFTRYSKETKEEVLIGVNRGKKTVTIKLGEKEYEIPAMYYILKDVK